VDSHRLAPGRLPGPTRAGPVVHVSARTEVYFYPSQDGVERVQAAEMNGRKVDVRWHTYGFGRIYVTRAKSVVAAYEARGGPKETFADVEGHIRSPIPPGDYVLGAAEHYTTSNWYMSSIPWGARIKRARGGEIEYDDGSGWKRATGSPDAPMTSAIRKFLARSGRVTPAVEARLDQLARAQFDINPDSPTGTLVSVWQRNDFGEWAFALLRGGKRTGFYIHTTPEDELDATHKLDSSHGCIHMRPVDRNEAKSKSYFARGTVLHVAAFDAKGPPR